MLQTVIHYSLHFLVPGLIAYVFFRKEWKKAWLIMVATMLIDVDHLLATPIFENHRCSINFHPLHTYWAMAVYVVLLFFKKTRIIAVGLLFHLLTDFIDCQW
jgi:predicted cobalt transporter CbtA